MARLLSNLPITITIKILQKMSKQIKVRANARFTSTAQGIGDTDVYKFFSSGHPYRREVPMKPRSGALVPIFKNAEHQRDLEKKIDPTKPEGWLNTNLPVETNAFRGPNCYAFTASQKEFTLDLEDPIDELTYLIGVAAEILGEPDVDGMHYFDILPQNGTNAQNRKLLMYDYNNITSFWKQFNTLGEAIGFYLAVTNSKGNELDEDTAIKDLHIKLTDTLYADPLYKESEIKTALEVVQAPETVLLATVYWHAGLYLGHIVENRSASKGNRFTLNNKGFKTAEAGIKFIIEGIKEKLEVWLQLEAAVKNYK